MLPLLYSHIKKILNNTEIDIPSGYQLQKIFTIRVYGLLKHKYDVIINTGYRSFSYSPVLYREKSRI